MSTRQGSAGVAVPPARGRRETAALLLRRAASLEELAAQQGVSPAEDLDEIGGLWPCADDPEELLEHILKERAARRGLARAEE